MMFLYLYYPQVKKHKYMYLYGPTGYKNIIENSPLSSFQAYSPDVFSMH